jgi:thioredoxin reductase/2-polyprenyl-3-methyl-5-hydroxy-6-metoxy-1,4-benzoquinol methylase
MDDHPPLPTSAEVVVVGAGFAGLSAALTLGRARRQLLVLGAGPTRNAESLHSHNLLTREGASPADLLAAGRAEVAALPTVTLVDAHVTAITAAAGGTAAEDGGGLRVVTDAGVHTADAVLLATGVRDALPDVPGLVELWGRRAHSCPFCDAGLYPGRRLALLADPPAAGHLDGLLAGWTDHRRVVAPGDVRQVVEVGDDVVVELVDGGLVHVDGVFAQSTPLPRLEAVADLPLDRRGPYLAVDGELRTSVPGLWAAGDCAWADGASGPGGQVVQAMADGSVAAIAIIASRAGIIRPAPPQRTPPPPRPTPGGSDDPHTDHQHADHRHDTHQHDTHQHDTHQHDTHQHDTHQHDEPPVDARAFWEARYAGADRVWSGRPSRGLVEAVAGAAPGRALELGCGEGADAVWLAEQGWQVTAIDLSATALDRAARTADRRGVADRITWRQADLAEGVPGDLAAPVHDLVLAAHLLSPAELPRDAVLRQAAAAVAPGGRLVILSHLHPPAGAPHPAHLDLPDVETQVDRLRLDAAWTVERAEHIEVRHRAADGTVATRPDTVLVLRRDPAVA